MKCSLLIVTVAVLLACGPMPQPTECLKYEKPDGSIEELCTSPYPEPMPTPDKLDSDVRDKMEAYQRQESERTGVERPEYAIRIVPSTGQKDGLVAWLESLGYSPRETVSGRPQHGFAIWINDPSFLKQLAERDDIEWVGEVERPEPHVEPDP